MSTAARRIATLAIVLVAGVAGWSSYWHITDLSLALGQPAYISYVLALAVDGLILAGSIVLLNGGKLGWICIIPGVLVSLFANVMSGLPHGYLAAAWAGVPALSFFLASYVLERWISRISSPASGEAEVLAAYDALQSVLEAHAALRSAHAAMTSASHAVAASQRLLEALPAIEIPPAEPASEEVTEARRARVLPTREGRPELPIVAAVDPVAEATPEPVQRPDTVATARPVREAAAEPVKPSRPKRSSARSSGRSAGKSPRSGKTGLTTAEKVARAAAKYPGLTQVELAAKAGVSERSVRRHLPAVSPA